MNMYDEFPNMSNRAEKHWENQIWDKSQTHTKNWHFFNSKI